MTGMARRKPQTPGEVAPIPAVQRAKPADRHKPRRMVGLTPEEHDLLSHLAEKNQRPLLWELRIALANHFAANGLKPRSKP